MTPFSEARDIIGRAGITHHSGQVRVVRDGLRVELGRYFSLSGLNTRMQTARQNCSMENRPNFIIRATQTYCTVYGTVEST